MKYKSIGWISQGMDVYVTDNYKAMMNHGKVRKPPKIYKTKEIAERYGTPVEVFIKEN